MSDLFMILAVIIGTALIIVMTVAVVMMFLPVLLNLWEWWSDTVDDFFDKWRGEDE